jgi:glycosyltransferase involved in cell wall biosynthesis
VGGDAVVYVDPDNIEGMTEAIETLLREEKVRQGWSQAGQLQAQRFSWSSTADRTEAVYAMITSADRITGQRR